MKQIIYTYDENKPTNKDYLIAALTDDIDDGGASLEAVTYYNISCPYSSGKTRCDDYPFEIPRDVCVECKTEWLAKEYDE